MSTSQHDESGLPTALQPSEAAPPVVPAAPPAPPVHDLRVPSSTGPGLDQTPGAWWAVLTAALRGDSPQLVRAAMTSGQRSGSPHRVWVFSALLNGLIIGIALMLLLARIADATGFGGGPSAGTYFGLLILPVLFSFGALVARAGALVGLFAMLQRPLAFRGALSIASVGFVASTPFLALVFLLSFVPGQFALIVLLLAGVFTAFFVEFAVFVCVVRSGRFERSPLVHHAALTTAWLAVVVWISAVIMADLVAQQFSGLFGGLL